MRSWWRMAGGWRTLALVPFSPLAPSLASDSTTSEMAETVSNVFDTVTHFASSIRTFPFSPLSPFHLSPPPANLAPLLLLAGDQATIYWSSVDVAQPISSLNQLLAAEEEDSKVRFLFLIPLRRSNLLVLTLNIACDDEAYSPFSYWLVGRCDSLSGFDYTSSLESCNDLHALVCRGRCRRSRLWPARELIDLVINSLCYREALMQPRRRFSWVWQTR